jgi:hypothetical protein
MRHTNIIHEDSAESVKQEALREAWHAAMLAVSKMQRIYNSSLTRVDQSHSILPLEQAAPIVRELQKTINDLYELGKGTAHGAQPSSRNRWYSAIRSRLPWKTRTESMLAESAWMQQKEWNSAIVHLFNEILNYLCDSTNKLRTFTEDQILYFQQITPWINSKIEELRSEQNHQIASILGKMTLLLDPNNSGMIENLQEQIALLKTQLKEQSLAYERRLNEIFFLAGKQPSFLTPVGNVEKQWETYVPFFITAPEPILDLTGENSGFLELMKRLGKSTYPSMQKQEGFEMNPRPELITGISHLQLNSIGSVISGRLSNCVAPEQLQQLIVGLHRIMKARSVLLIEADDAPNPSRQSDFLFDSRILDFALRSSGFDDVQIHSFVAADRNLELPNPDRINDPETREFLKALVNRMNGALQSHFQYYVVGYRT